MKYRLVVDIYWCALSATWCYKTFTIIHAQNIVVQKIFVRAEGDAAASHLDPPLTVTVKRRNKNGALSLDRHFSNSSYVMSNTDTVTLLSRRCYVCHSYACNHL